MDYLNVKEIAEKWGVNVSLVRKYCAEGRIPNAVLRNGVWCIPEDAIRPVRTQKAYAYDEVLPELPKKLKNQKKKRNFHGLYDFVVIDLTYSSSRMASCRLTRQQVETIFRKGKIRESFEPLKVSDVIEVLNHIHCVNYILDHVMEPLTQKFIRKIHEIHGVEAPDGTLIVQYRNHNCSGLGETWQSESTDSGKSWSVPHKICKGFPTHLQVFDKDKVIMTYTYRLKPFGIRARVSKDSGKSWGEEIILSDDGKGWDLGYPSTVELADGTLFTMWYENRGKGAKLRTLNWKFVK